MEKYCVGIKVEDRTKRIVLFYFKNNICLLTRNTVCIIPEMISRTKTYTIITWKFSFAIKWWCTCAIESTAWKINIGENSCTFIHAQHIEYSMRMHNQVCYILFTIKKIHWSSYILIVLLYQINNYLLNSSSKCHYIVNYITYVNISAKSYAFKVQFAFLRKFNTVMLVIILFCHTLPKI